jgi:hypothetical protein
MRVERILHFDFGQGELVKEGFAHFGFFDRSGNHYAIAHQKHFVGRIEGKNRLKWTVGARPAFEGVPNITADLRYPIYIDSLLDGGLVVSNFGDSRLFRVDPGDMRAELFFDGSAAGMKSAGNCVVDDDGNVWVNDVEGCRIWRLDSRGRETQVLGNGEPGFQAGPVGFDDARFNWIYDIRRGPSGDIYVLDSRNYAVRVIETKRKRVRTLAGTGKPGYDGDGRDANEATFGSDPTARFDGPISLSVDEDGNAYVGDRFNHVVRRIDGRTNVINTIAGDSNYAGEESNDENEKDLSALRLPKISSMDYHKGLLMIPTDLREEMGDLVILRR